MLLLLWQIPKTSPHRDKKPCDRTDSLAQKWGWTALPHITTHVLPTGKVLLLFYLSYSNTCDLDMDFYSRHITMFTIRERNLIHADSPRSPKPTPVTSAELFKCQRCQVPTFTDPPFCRETASDISLCCWRHLCLLSQTKDEEFWLSTTVHQLSKVLMTKTNTSSTSANTTLSEPHLYPGTPCYQMINSIKPL